MSATTSILCKIVITLLPAIVPRYALSQCSATSAISGSSFTTQSLTGSSYNWSNNSYLNMSDNNRATASAVIGILSGSANYLKVTGFNFSIPPGSGICGIKVEIEKSGSNIGVLTSIQDNEIKLIKDGTITGSNKATNTDWTNTDGYYSYGGISDKWGTTWSLADINSGNFGVAISAQILGIVGVLPSARIDHLQVTVYYNLVLPISIISFTATPVNNNVKLAWKTSEATHTERFTVQRSIDGINWESIKGNIKHDVWLKEFEFYDNKPHAVAYYRLKTETEAGAIHYTETRKSEVALADRILTYPNPATTSIQIKVSKPSLIKIYNQSGVMVLTTLLSPASNSIDISGLKPGLYFLISNENSQKMTFQKMGK